jgi:hypothetical protein
MKIKKYPQNVLRELRRAVKSVEAELKKTQPASDYIKNKLRLIESYL